MKFDIVDCPRVTLVVTTYNRPDYLAITLKTVLEQRRAPYEVVVADDGSNESTADVVRKFAETASFPILHAWQADSGYRLNASRNNALAVASGDYVVMLDGDCFLNPFFICDHLFFARPNRYVGGTRVNVRSPLKERILTTRDTRVGFFTPGTSKKFNAVRCRALARIASSSFEGRRRGGGVAGQPFWRNGLAGANLAFWRDDAFKVNGFNEVMKYYGGNDLEFASRLERAGVGYFHMVHYGMAYHFAHGKPYSGSSEDRLTPESKEYRESLTSDGIRCKDEAGLTRALEKARGFERPDRGYCKIDLS